jgi:hypothetical protein
MRKGLERMWKEAVVAKHKVLFQNMPGVTENYEKPQSGQRVDWPRFEPIISRY